MYATAAVFCAADACDHRDCFRGPFGVFFVFCIEEAGDDEGCVAMTRLYSSETGAWDHWADQAWINHPLSMRFTFHSSVLVGSSLLYFMTEDGYILEYDFPRHKLSVFYPPNDDSRYNIMLSEDGGLGVSQETNLRLKLWTREASDGTDARRVLSRVICLENVLPDSALVDAASPVYVLGSAEGANVIFVTTVAGLFKIELQSERMRRVCDDHGFCNLIPIVSFYTPVSRVEWKDPLEPSEDACGEKGAGEEEKTVDQAHQLFGNRSNIIKEGGFLNASDHVSHTLDNRVPPNGEIAPESTDMGVVLYESVTSPSSDVLKTAQMKNR